MEFCVWEWGIRIFKQIPFLILGSESTSSSSIKRLVKTSQYHVDFMDLHIYNVLNEVENSKKLSLCLK